MSYRTRLNPLELPSKPTPTTPHEAQEGEEEVKLSLSLASPNNKLLACLSDNNTRRKSSLRSPRSPPSSLPTAPKRVSFRGEAIAPAPSPSATALASASASTLPRTTTATTTTTTATTSTIYDERKRADEEEEDGGDDRKEVDEDEEDLRSKKKRPQLQFVPQAEEIGSKRSNDTQFKNDIVDTIGVTLRPMRLFTITWNLHAKPPPADLSDLLPLRGFDLYVIGTEECENSIEMSFIFSSKDKWVAAITNHLGAEFVQVSQKTLQAVHLIVFIRQTLQHLVSRVETGRVATGIGSIVGNKGGVAVGFSLGITSFLFVNSHFTAHQNFVEQRNRDFHRINTKLKLRQAGDTGENTEETPLPIPKRREPRSELEDSDDEEEAEPLVSPSSPTALPTTPALAGRQREKAELMESLKSPLLVCNRFDCVIWMGDLNYRVNTNRSMADALIAKDMLEVMRANDQLIREMDRGRVFCGFSEGEIRFPPTYKYDTGSDTYDSSTKQRIQSWTDRILYRVGNSKAAELLQLVLLQYDAVASIRTSDHKPVFAKFDLCVAIPPELVEEETSAIREVGPVEGEGGTSKSTLSVQSSMRKDTISRICIIQ